MRALTKEEEAALLGDEAAAPTPAPAVNPVPAAGTNPVPAKVRKKSCEIEKLITLSVSGRREERGYENGRAESC